MDTDYRGWRATVMGLGHFGGGVAAARWLARQGAIVTVSDVADEKALADSLAQLAVRRSRPCTLAVIAREISATPSWWSSARPFDPKARGSISRVAARHGS